MAASSLDKDAVAQNRIITHMNNDHSDSVLRYLRHYRGVSSFSARNARLISITFKDMTIESSSFPTMTHQHTIPLDPPLKAWTEARARLVDMDGACKGLGCSTVTVKRYAPPTTLQAVLFGLFSLAYSVLCQRANSLLGSFCQDLLFKYIPGFIGVVHVGEALHLAITRLEKHTVPTFSWLWWQWIASILIEGFGTRIRFDRLVKEETVKKEQQKH